MHRLFHLAHWCKSRPKSVASLALLTGIVVFWLLPESGPRYHGKGVSYWFAQFPWPGRVDERLEPVHAFQHFGDDALPFLLSCVTNAPTTTDVVADWCKVKLNAFAGQNASGKSKINWLTTSERRTKAISILGSMGTSASNAAPVLLSLVFNPIEDPSTIVLAGNALLWVTPNPSATINELNRAGSQSLATNAAYSTTIQRLAVQLQFDLPSRTALQNSQSSSR